MAAAVLVWGQRERWHPWVPPTGAALGAVSCGQLPRDAATPSALKNQRGLQVRCAGELGPADVWVTERGAEAPPGLAATEWER